jgi:hypothetical protein
MTRKVRHTICKDLWLDIDFVNCHPVLLLQMCNKLLKSREEMLQEMVDAGVSDREAAKKLILKALNGGKTDVNTAWWGALCKEFESIASEIATHDNHEDYLVHCKQEKGSHNLHARTMNAVLCKIENDCLEQLYGCLKDLNCMPTGQCCLVFDGLMIPETPSIKTKLSSPGFFDNVSNRIHKETGYSLKIKLKDFDEGLDLPANLASLVSDVFVLDEDKDVQAAEECVRRLRHRLIRCKKRIFWEEDGIYTDDPETVKNGVLQAVVRMKIFTRGKDKLIPYSSDVRLVAGCIKLVLGDKSLEQPDFIDKLFQNSLRYLAFKDGVYCFMTKQLLPYPVEGVYFTTKINRLFPTNVDAAITDELINRVLIPSFPDKEQRDFYLYRMARCMAGDIYDKRWHICIGERNSSKGVCGDLFSKCFGDFVQVFNSENLLSKPSNMGGGDAAKSQSWMSDLEFKRLVMSHEVQLQNGRAT